MRAVVLRAFGPPQALSVDEVPDLRPGVGEVVIDVEYASVTFVETQLRAGRAPDPRMLPELPAILGNGVGGTITATGARADEELLGDQVITSLSGTGGYAEQVAAPASRLIEVPAGVSLRDAVALLADGRTAIGLIRRALIRPGDTVLVEAAAGGVGSLLVQLAARAGARVVALASSERKLALARELGADLAVSYATPGWPEAVRAEAGRVDVVFDGVSGEVGVAAFGLLEAGGRFVSFGMASGTRTPIPPGVAKERQVAVLTPGQPSAYEMREYALAALAEGAAGRLRPVIGQVYDLAQAADAHAAIEARATIGKTLLTTGG